MARRSAVALAAALALVVTVPAGLVVAAPDPTAPPTVDRSDRMPVLTEQQRDELLGPGTRQDPATAGERLPQAAVTSPLARSGAVTDARPAYACRGYSSIPRSNPAAQVRRDVFAWGAYPPARVGNGRGDIDWRSDPYKQVTWRMWLHSLRWLGNLIDAGAAGDARALAHASAIARDWTRDNPYSWQASAAAWESTMHRANVLLCLRQAIATQAGGTRPASAAWLDQALVQHAEFLTRHFSGWGNHGTDESVALLGIGCTLRRPAYTDLAASRLAQAVGRAIDAQGATNEQASAYAYFNHGLWSAARDRLAACAPGARATTTATQRLGLLGTFLAHATTPLGWMHQLGNSEQKAVAAVRGTPQEWAATRGARGRPPGARGVVYAAGYVFGRTGWGTARSAYRAQSAYSLRFGPARALHGHSDHMALTWQAQGREILRDTGFGEYTRDAWQAYAKSPQAHNQLVVSGMSEYAATRLTSKAFRQTRSPGAPEGAPPRIGDAFRLQDAPAGGVTRIRDVIIMSEPDVVLVADRVTSASRRNYQQRWHLPRGQVVAASARGTSVVATSGSARTTLVQLPYRAGVVPAGTASVAAGGSRPILGWHWPDIFTRQAAPTVSFARSGRSAAMVTAIAAGTTGERVTATVTPTRGGATLYTITVGSRVAKVQLGRDGLLSRVW